MRLGFSSGAKYSQTIQFSAAPASLGCNALLASTAGPGYASVACDQDGGPACECEAGTDGDTLDGAGGDAGPTVEDAGATSDASSG